MNILSNMPAYRRTLLKHTPQTVQNNQGLAIISTMTAIVVGLIMLGGSLTIVPESTGIDKFNEAMRQLQDVRIGIRELYQNEASYNIEAGRLTNAIALAGGVFPDTMTKGDGADPANIKNPWDGFVTVGPGSAAPGGTTAADTSFYIEYASVPTDACIKIASSVQEDWQILAINSQVITNQVAGTAAGLPGITAACGASATVSMVFISK